jgi:dolichol-phosphate mannosyltransferase
MIKLALDGITSFSTVPLRLMTQIGILISILSLMGIIFALFVRIFIPEATIPGTTFAIIATLFIGGVQIFMMGILGTYIGRIYSEVQGRPLYIVSSVYAED